MNFRVISNFANILVLLNSRAILIISELFESLKTVLSKNNSHLINTIIIPLCVNIQVNVHITLNKNNFIQSYVD